jgi:hypothetical protein
VEQDIETDELDAQGTAEITEAVPGDFKLCISCNRALNEDERIINARFVNEALERGQDISVFPVCIKCNFE